MTQDRIIEANVMKFMCEAAELHGKLCEERFSIDMYRQLSYGACHSPIEDMFFIALHAICAAWDVQINPGPQFTREGLMKPGNGLIVQTQANVGKYRVDFLLTQIGLTDELCPPVVIELDGHAFHDKDKHQRAYEKARDRFLVKEGLRVLHFTGSEVVVDPFKVAYEALTTLGCLDIPDYNPAIPLGCEV